MSLSESDIKAIQSKLNALKGEIQKVIIGQESVVDLVLVALFSNGHALLQGVPGLAKTLLVKTLAASLDLSFGRIQFTPDLMPSDLIGTDLLMEDPESGKRYFEFIKGPLFNNIILADEINRTPPKTQAALLEAMQERKISYAGKSHQLDLPYLILATQNPIEQGGTFPLPEAQRDRFLLQIDLDYPSEATELKILQSKSEKMLHSVEAQMSKSELMKIQELVDEIYIDDKIYRRINKIIRNSRPQSSEIAQVKENLEWGAGPRAGQALVQAAKANAFLNKRLSVIPADIEKLLEPILIHRLILNFNAEASGINKKDIIQTLFNQST